MADRGKFSHHDPKVVSVFEVLSAYLTDNYFNHVYRIARSKLTQGDSLTDQYVQCIQSFAMGVKNDEACYSKLVQSLWHYFTSMTRYTAISFSEFVDRVTESCVPPEYFNQFSTTDKDEVLSSMLYDLTVNLAAFATKPEILRRIIDEHDVAPSVTVRILQDAGVDFLLTKRATLRNAFLKKMGQARDQVPMDVVEDMKKALRRLVKEKAEAVAQSNLASSECERLRHATQELRVRCAKFEKLVKLLQDGKEIGPAAAVAALKAPKPNRLAEPAPIVSHPPSHRRRERLAEPSSSEEYSDEGDSDEGDSDEGDSESVSSAESVKRRSTLRRRTDPQPAAPPSQRPTRAPPAATPPPSRALDKVVARPADRKEAGRSADRKVPPPNRPSVRPAARPGPVTADFFKTSAPAPMPAPAPASVPASAPAPAPAPAPGAPSGGSATRPGSLMSLLSGDGSGEDDADFN